VQFWGDGDEFFSAAHVAVVSPVGACTLDEPSLLRCVVRLHDAGIPLAAEERDAIELIASIPYAFADEQEETSPRSGPGWRVVPAMHPADWPVLEVTPQSLGGALEVVRALLWRHATTCAFSAADLGAVDREIETISTVVLRARNAGHPLQLSFVA
jgi:hypothetical protein